MKIVKGILGVSALTLVVACTESEPRIVVIEKPVKQEAPAAEVVAQVAVSPTAEAAVAESAETTAAESAPETAPAETTEVADASVASSAEASASSEAVVAEVAEAVEATTAAAEPVAAADASTATEVATTAATSADAPSSDVAHTASAEKVASAEPATDQHHDVHWTYDGDAAPHAWGMLKNEYATCAQGKQQSPIDISTTTITALSDIGVAYQPSKINVENNGHTIKLNYDEGSVIKVGGKDYKLLQFHFHSPSEHSIGGKSYDMVAHLVHQSEDGQLGVIGVMMKEGKENEFLKKFWANLPQQANSSFESNQDTLNVTELLPPDLAYFNYEGSLTTPPCSEGVNWMVLATPVEVSNQQIASFKSLFNVSTRPVQPLNGRTIRLSNL